jgi:hypothetical protein
MENAMTKSVTLTSPSGKTFVVPDVPDGASEADVWRRAQALYGDRLNTATSDDRSGVSRFASGALAGAEGDAAGLGQTAEALFPETAKSFKSAHPDFTARMRDWKKNALAPASGPEWWGRQAGAAAPFAAASLLPGVGEIAPLGRIASTALNIGQQAGIGAIAGASQPTEEGGIHPDAIAAGAAFGGAGGALGEGLSSMGARGAATARQSQLARQASDLVHGRQPFQDAINAGATTEQANAYAAEVAQAAHEQRQPNPRTLTNIFGSELAGHFLHMPFLGHAGAIAGSLPAIARGASRLGANYGGPLSTPARAIGQGAASEAGKYADDPRMGYSVTPGATP